MVTGYPDWQGNKVGTWEKSDWSVFEGENVQFYLSETVSAGSNVTTQPYTVPAGKTFALTNISFARTGDEGAIAVLVYDWESGTYIATLAGQQGGGMSFKTPPTMPSGHHMYVYIVNPSATSSLMYVTITGYEFTTP